MSTVVPFMQKITHGVVVDHIKNPWIVVVPVGHEKGDIVNVTKKDGTVFQAKLVTEVPYVVTKGHEFESRWTFLHLDEGGRIEGKGRQIIADMAVRKSEEGEDGYPHYWPRREDNGKVYWPRGDDVWQDNETGVNFKLKVDTMTGRRVGVYPMGGGPGEWMPMHEFMDNYAFVFRVYKRQKPPIVLNSRQVFSIDDVNS